LYFEIGHNLNENDLTIDYERRNGRGKEQHNITLGPHTKTKWLNKQGEGRFLNVKDVVYVFVAGGSRYPFLFSLFVFGCVAFVMCDSKY